MINKRQQQLKPDPMKIPDPLDLFSDPMERPVDGGRVSSASAMMSSASVAASVSAQVAMDDGVIVMPPVHSEPTGNDATETLPKTDGARVDLTSTKPNATLTQCEHCDHEFIACRPWTRCCSAYCRRRAWLERNPEKAAALAEKDKARLRTHYGKQGWEWRNEVTQ